MPGLRQQQEARPYVVIHRFDFYIARVKINADGKNLDEGWPLMDRKENKLEGKFDQRPRATYSRLTTRSPSDLFNDIAYE